MILENKDCNTQAIVSSLQQWHRMGNFLPHSGPQWSLNVKIWGYSIELHWVLFSHFFYKDLWKQTNFTPLTMDHINNMLKLQLSHYLNCDGGKIYMSPSIIDSMDWVWVNSGSWWRTGRPGVLQFMGSQRVGHDWATELNWSNVYILFPAIWSTSIFLQLLTRYDFGK